VDDVRVERTGCQHAPADINRDGRIDGSDLGLLLGAWGSGGLPAADVNGDGTVNGSDLGLLLGAWTT